MNRTVVHDSCALLPGRIGIMPPREREYFDEVHQPAAAGGLFFMFFFLCHIQELAGPPAKADLTEQRKAGVPAS